MAQLEPDIVVVDGGDEDGGNTAAPGAHHIGIDLVTGQSALLRRQAVLRQTLADALGEGLLGMGDTVDAVIFAENTDTLPQEA